MRMIVNKYVAETEKQLTMAYWNIRLTWITTDSNALISNLRNGSESIVNIVLGRRNAMTKFELRAQSQLRTFTASH
jgi:hypothetical protein